MAELQHCSTRIKSRATPAPAPTSLSLQYRSRTAPHECRQQREYDAQEQAGSTKRSLQTQVSTESFSATTSARQRGPQSQDDALGEHKTAITNKNSLTRQHKGRRERERVKT